MAKKAHQENSTSADAPKHVYLIDGSGFIFRAYFSAFKARNQFTRSDGTPIGAVFIFTRMLRKIIEDTDADHVAVIFDAARKTFRNEIYEDYKANRPPPPEDLIPQFPLVRKAVEAFNVEAVEMENYEADDLIATYAKQAVEKGARVTIVSSDKDLMQLVNDHVELYDAMKDQPIRADEVREKFGVGPDKVIEVQALSGDSTDNIPGVPGIGPKTAAELIREYGDLENLLEHAQDIKQPKRRENLIEHADNARMSMELVTLKNDVPVPVPLDKFRKRDLDPKKLLAFLEEQEFKSIIAEEKKRLGMEEDDDSAPPASDRERKEGYELIRTEADLKRWVDEAMDVGTIAVDTETTSLDALQAELVGVSLAFQDGRACYIPLRHRAAKDQGQLDLAGDGQKGGEEVEGQIPFDKAINILKPMLEDDSVLKVGHHIKYDMKVLAREHNGAIHMTPIDDTMLLSYVLEGGLHGHGLDELSEFFLGHTNIKFAEVAGSGKKQVSFDYVDVKKALDYAAEDADMTARLHKMLKPRLVKEHMVTVYETLERPLVPVLAEMELAGIKVDARELSRLSTDFKKRLGDLAEEIYRIAGHEFTIGSPKQLGEVLFVEMGLEGGRKSAKTGAYSTSADVLEDLAAQGHDLPQKVLDWRQLDKLRGTYTDALAGYINPETGRVHTHYGQSVASTGRLSSSDPNLQNIPIRTEEGRKIRKAFVAEKGHVLLSADYSQIELRLLAHVADITALKQAFRDGKDIHALTASEVFGVPMEDMDPTTRRKAKAINFGIIYGISPFGLARQLSIPQKEAKDFIEAYFRQYPGVKDYMESAVEMARSQGFVQTLFGRKVHTPNIKSKNAPERNFAERAAINAPIQGGAADIIKRAMIRLPGALAAAKLETKMLLQVHDELIFEVPEGEVDKAGTLIKEVMEGAANLSVPLDVDMGTGPNWDEAH